MYVVELVAPGVVNTMPEATLDAVADHGVVRGDTVRGEYARRPRRCRRWPTSASTSTTSCRCSRTRASRSSRRRGTSCSSRPRPSSSGSATADAGVSVDGPGSRVARRRRASDGAGGAGWSPRTRPCGAPRPARGRAPARLARPARRPRRSCSPSCASCASGCRAEGLDHVVLAGMGGSSLAPEVITRTAGADLTSSTAPTRTRSAPRSPTGSSAPSSSSRPRAAARSRPTATGGPTSRPSGTPASPTPRSPSASSSSPTRARRCTRRPRARPATPSCSPTPTSAAATAPCPRSASPRATSPAPTCSACSPTPGCSRASSASDDNPGLELGRALGNGRQGGRDKLVLADAGSGIVGFGDWAEQLVAESTGKQGTGHPARRRRGHRRAGLRRRRARRLPRRRSGPGRPGCRRHGGQRVARARSSCSGSTPRPSPAGSSASTRSTSRTWPSPRRTPSKILDEAGDGPLPEGQPALVDGAVEVHGDLAALGCADRPRRRPRRRCCDQVPERGYLAVMAYLDRDGDGDAAGCAPRLAGAWTAAPVTFGWAPRFLHSTGQFHKGGPQVGVFLQITGAVDRRTSTCPGRPYTFGRLQMAQALGDQRALAERGRPGPAPAPDRPAGRASRQLLAAAAAGRPGDDGELPAADGHPAGRRPPDVAPARTRCATRATGGCRGCPEPCALVVFGVTGDLARKKLIPAVYDLANRGLLPPGFALLGFARRDWGDGDFAALARAAAAGRAPGPGSARRSGSGWPTASGSCPGSFDDDDAFDQLAATLIELEETHGIQGNAAFYLSIPPAMFPVVLKQMQRTGMADNAERGGWRRVVVEKPFGHDLQSAPRAQRAGRRGVHRRRTSSASTTTSARRRSRTCWRCASPTRCSSRSGTATSSTRCRSRWPRTSASAAGPASTTRPAPPATCCRTTCCSCSR